MRRATSGYVLVAAATAAISVTATLVAVNRGGDHVRVATTGAKDRPAPRVDDATPPAPVQPSPLAPSTPPQPSNLASPTNVRTQVPVTANGCSGASDPPIRGDVVGIASSDGVEEVSIDGTRRFRVDGPTGSQSSPSWSADGRFVAFTVGTWQDEPRPSLGIANIASHCWRVWPRGKDAYTEPSLSSDGSKVVYAVGPNGTTMTEGLHAELADADGSHRERISDHASTAGSAAWAPDNSGRFVISDRQGLKVRDRSGRITMIHEVPDSEFVSWAPGSRRLAYSVSTQAGVWVAEADGTGHRKLVDGLATIFWMSWSPDGTHIAYANSNSIWVVSADGGPPSEVTDGGSVGWGTPLWAPDGKSILYTAPSSTSGQSEYRVLAVAVQGGTPRVVADNARLMTVFHRD